MRRTKIVLDLEFISVKINQPYQVKRNEIIEIGAIALDNCNKKIDIFQMYVKPQYGTVPPFITEITNITNDMLEHAVCFSAAMQAFEQWVQELEPCRFYTWSENDQIIMLREAEWKKRVLPPVFYAHWVDLQRLHQRIYHFSRPLRLVDALGSMQIPFEGIEHGALTDAKNTAEVLKRLSDLKRVKEKRKHDYVTYNEDAAKGFPLGIALKSNL